MEKYNWVDYKISVRERLRAFSLSILSLSEKIPEHARGRVINYQITKSGTSMYANYRAALRARSKAEFFSKLSIVVEEADETEMWLDLLISSSILPKESLKDIHNECIDLMKILSQMRKSVSKS